MKRLTVATKKPFAADAIDLIKDIAEDADYEFHLLEKYQTQSELAEAVKNTDALIVRSDKIDKEILSAGDKLKIVVRAGAGYDNVDLQAAKEKAVVVMNTPGQNANAVAELAAGMMIYMLRNRFNGSAGSELRGKKLGIHAFGNVGRNLARIALGIGMEVFAFDAFVKPEDIEAEGVKPLDSVEDLYSTAQFISLHIPANEETVKSVDEHLLRLMPPQAVLVNTARKEIIHEEDLLNFMANNSDFTYISDIKPDKCDEFEKNLAEQIFFTPKKMGAQTKEANVNAGVAAAGQIVNFFENGDETYRVN